VAVFHRFEIVTAEDRVRTVGFRDHEDAILLGSLAPIARREIAAVTIDWLRAALLKDWLYRIGRDRARSGPRFSLCAPNGVACVSPSFSSSDRMERAIEVLKTHCRVAPVLTRAVDPFEYASVVRSGFGCPQGVAGPLAAPRRSLQPAAGSGSRPRGSGA
jgi:hypothetical protein